MQVWPSLLSVITNISTKSAVVILISSNLFGTELTLRVEKINLLLWLLFFCLHKSSKSFLGSWQELGSEFSELIDQCLTRRKTRKLVNSSKYTNKFDVADDADANDEDDDYIPRKKRFKVSFIS